MSFIKRHPMLVFVISFLVIVGSLNYSGFCFKKMGYVSDDEAIKVLLADFLRTKITSESLSFYPYGYRGPMITDNMARQFVDSNPDCCRAIHIRNWKTFTDGSLLPGNSWFDRICGLGGAIVVEVKHKGIFYPDKPSIYLKDLYKEQPRRSIITNCGEIYQWK